jgi:hypothetical protein
VVRDVILGDHFEMSGPNAIGKVVLPPHPRPERRVEPPRRTVLLLLSNPVDAPPLRLEEEHRAIDRAIAMARYREQIDLRTGMAVRYDDLHELLLRHQPAVVHYAGHNSADGIALMNDHGRASPVHPSVLEELFDILGDSVSCVVLNACLTQSQARAISAHVPCVVGMSGPVLDPVAIAFAAGFYRAIANGQSVESSFRLGRNGIRPQWPHNRDPELFAQHDAAGRTFITG